MRKKMMQTLALVLIAGAVAWVLLHMAGPDTSGEDARALVANGALLLDVRTSTEFQAGHISGAKNISVAQLAKKLDDVGPRDRPVVVYCRSGARSGRAQRILQQAGFTVVHNLGSMNRW